MAGDRLWESKGQGFWVNSEGEFQLAIEGDTPVNTFPQVHTGWNLVGLSGNSTKTVSQIVQALDYGYSILVEVAARWRELEGQTAG